MQRLASNKWTMSATEKNRIETALQKNGIARIGGYTITPLNHVFVETQKDIWLFWFKSYDRERQ